MGAEAPRRETGFPCGDHSVKRAVRVFSVSRCAAAGPAWFCHAGRTRLTEGQGDFRAAESLTASGSTPPTYPRAKAGETRFAGGTSAPQRA